jgi:hypothetical protein
MEYLVLFAVIIITFKAHLTLVQSFKNKTRVEFFEIIAIFVFLWMSHHYLSDVLNGKIIFAISSELPPDIEEGVIREIITGKEYLPATKIVRQTTVFPFSIFSFLIIHGIARLYYKTSYRKR